MALTDHQKTYIDPSQAPIVAQELLQMEDELDRVQMDIEAGRMSEARAKFVRMDRALRESPRALVLRAKASPSKNSHEMIAAVAREQVRRVTDPAGRLHLATALALCGDYEWAVNALPGSVGLSASLATQRQEAVKLIGRDPEKAVDSRGTLERFIDRWLGVRQ